MEFKTLRLHNFMSYKDAELSLKQRGLVLVEGQKNGVTTFSNGSGKTNLFEAIPWCLWGSLISKKVPANDVVFDDGSDCEVSFEIDNFKVTRYRKHKEFKNELYLRINGKDARGASEAETQRKIDTLVGSSLESFSNSIFLGQTMIKSFASSTETERKVILEKLLGNERYQEILKDIIQPQIKDAKEKSEDLDDDLELIKEEKTKTINRISFLKEKHQAFDREKFLKIESIRAKLNISTTESPDAVSSVDLEKEIKKYEGEIEGLSKQSELAPLKIEKEITKYEVEIAGYSKYLETLPTIEQEIHALVKDLAKIEADREVVEREISKLERQLSAPITTLTDKECPTCGKVIEKKDVDLYKSKIEEKIEKLKATIPFGAKPLRTSLSKKQEEKQDVQQYQSLINSTRKKIQDLHQEENREIQQYQSLINTIRRKISDVQNELKEISKREEKERAAREQLKVSLREAQELVSPYPELIKKEEDDVKVSTTKEKGIVDKLSAIKEQLPYWNILENMFSRTGKQELPSIPSLKLDSVIPNLTESVNRRLREVSDDISVEFDTTSSTQRGKITDKFSIKVKNANGADVYGGNSGGEKKIVDICILLALGEIAGMRTQNTTPILLLDELFGTLDSSNKEAVMELLRGEAKTKDSIFVTTLSDELTSMFENKIIVNKLGKVSYLIDSTCQKL